MRILVLMMALYAAIGLGGGAAFAGGFAELQTRLREMPAEFVVVEAWSPWCEPCGDEVIELNKIAEGDRGFLSVLGVPVQGRQREIRAFVEHFKPKFEQWSPDGGFLALFRAKGALPWTMLFDGSRRLRKEWVGGVSAAVILDEIRIVGAGKKNGKDRKKL